MKKVRVLILAPFRYIYGNKNFYIGTGESMYLNLSISEEKEELKYILSPQSEYRNYIYVEESELPSDFLQDMKLEQEGIPLPNPNEILTVEIEKTEIDLTAPPQEPEENIFLTPEVHEVTNSSVEEVVTEESAAVEEQLQVPGPSVEELKAIRSLELEEMPWRKIEKIAAALNIDYKNKDQAMQDILAAEFK